MLKRSKVEMTACSGLSWPVSKLDSWSLPSLARRDTTLRFLEGRVLSSGRFGKCRADRGEHSGRVMSRTQTQKDLGRSIESLYKSRLRDVARCSEDSDGPLLPLTTVSVVSKFVGGRISQEVLIIFFYSFAVGNIRSFEDPETNRDCGKVASHMGGEPSKIKMKCSSSS